MADPLTPSKGLTLPSLGGDFGLWGQLLNNNLSLIDSAAGGTLFLAVTGNSILTSVQTQNTGYKFSGSLSGNSSITWPAFSGIAAIQNNTLGGYAIICGVSGGSTVTISGGTTLSVWSDGTNFLPLSLFAGGGTASTTGSGAIVLQTMPTIITPNVSGFLTLQGTVSGASVLTAPVSGGGTIFFPGGNKTLAANDLSNVTLTGDASNTNAAITVTNLSHVTNNSLAPAGLASGYVTLGSTVMNIGAALGTSGVSGLSVLNSTLVSGTSGNFQNYKQILTLDTGYNIFGSVPFLMATHGNTNGGVFYVLNDSASGSATLPCALAGYGNLASGSTGNQVFGVYGLSQVPSGMTAGVANAAEFTVRNYAGTPDYNLPPNRGFGSNTIVPSCLTITCGGTFNSSIGITVSNETGVPTPSFGTAIYVGPYSYSNYGLWIDTPGSVAATSAVIKNNGNGINLALITTGATQPNNAVITYQTSGGSFPFAVRQSGQTETGNIVAGGTITANAVSTTGTLTAAVVSGARVPVLNPASSYQLLTTDSFSCFTNLTSGLFVLPASGVAVVGTNYTFAVVTSGNTLLVSGGSSITIALGTNISVSGLISSNSPYSTLTLLCVSGNKWIADRATGAWIVT